VSALERYELARLSEGWGPALTVTVMVLGAAVLYGLGWYTRGVHDAQRPEPTARHRPRPEREPDREPEAEPDPQPAPQPVDNPRTVSFPLPQLPPPGPAEPEQTGRHARPDWLSDPV
jgi:hypothetical protein